MTHEDKIREIYEKITFIPVPKETFETMLKTIDDQQKQIAKLSSMNIPIEPFCFPPCDYPKLNRTYSCGDCGKKIAKGDMYCRTCGRKVFWK